MMKTKLGLPVAALGVCGWLAACVHDPSLEEKGVPPALKTPPNETLSIAAHGAGVQIYVCELGPAATFAWTLKAPEAQLRYEAGKELGKHYAGPTWEADDGSKVVGEVVAHEAGPDPDAVAWLLLRARSTSGVGVFSGITSIQRLHTAGGKAPSAGCEKNYLGTEVRVAYSADYYFYTARP